MGSVSDTGSEYWAVTRTASLPAFYASKALSGLDSGRNVEDGGKKTVFGSLSGRKQVISRDIFRVLGGWLAGWPS